MLTNEAFLNHKRGFEINAGDLAIISVSLSNTLPQRKTLNGLICFFIARFLNNLKIGKYRNYQAANSLYLNLFSNRNDFYFSLPLRL